MNTAIMNGLRFVMFALALALQAGAFANDITQVQALRSSPPAAPILEQRYLVGPDADSSWLGRTGELTTFSEKGWKFDQPELGASVLDLETGEIYSFVGASNNAELWPGSEWATVTRSRLQGVGRVERRNYPVTRRDDGGWIAVYPTPSATITLPNPSDDTTVQGMSIIIEASDNPIAEAGVVVVTGGGSIRLPDGSSTSRWVLPSQSGDRDFHTFRLTAGTSFSAYDWYVSEL